MKFVFAIPFVVVANIFGALSMESSNHTAEAEELLKAFREYQNSSRLMHRTAAENVVTLDEPEPSERHHLTIDENEQSNITIPGEILQMIWPNVDNLMSIHDFTLTCKYYHREYVGNLFFEFARSMYPEFLIQACRLFNPRVGSFGGSWEGKSTQEVFSLICKVVLSLPHGIENDNFTHLDFPSLLHFRRVATELLAYMSVHHKFDNTEQYVQFFSKFDKEYLGAVDDEFPLPNAHFSKRDAVKAIVGTYNWQFKSSDAIDMIVNLILSAFDNPIDIDEQLSKIEAIGAYAQCRFLEKLLEIEKIPLYNDARRCFYTRSLYLSALISLVDMIVDNSRILNNFTQTTIRAILSQEDTFNIPKRMGRKILARLSKSKVDESEMTRIFSFLLRSGYSVDQLKSFIENLNKNI